MSLMNIIRSYPFDRIKRLYDINVHGAFFTAREAARNMIPQGGGSIVLVASMSASVRFQSKCRGAAAHSDDATPGHQHSSGGWSVCLADRWRRV